jgi:hypothetical protein
MAGRSLPIGKSQMQSIVEGTRVLSVPLGRTRLREALTRNNLLYETSGAGKVLSPDGDYANASAGAVALALLTEVRYSRASGDTRFADVGRAWLEGLIALRIPGDGFRMFPTSIDATAYFDGEAWLALAEYHRAHPQDARVADELEDLDDALLSKYGNAADAQFYHWGAMAAAARYADTRDVKFLSFIKTQTTKFLDRRKDRTDSFNNCASIEGMADALGALAAAGESGGEVYRRARDWAAAEMKKAKQLQIQPGQQELLFPNARVVAPRMQEFAGDFRSGLYSADTQVDFTGHCVSAMVKLTRHKIALPD